MKTLIVGASGATGRLLVEQLLFARKEVKILVRPSAHIPELWQHNEQIHMVHRNIAEINSDEMAVIISDCDAVASCLGHNLTFKGLFGKPRRLVTNAIQLICEAILQNNADKPMKFVLMNTVGNQNRDLKEPISTAQKILMALIRLFIPPHADNEKASDYLRLQVGQVNPKIEWVVVRPDTLIDEEQLTDYSLHPSPTTSAVFKAGKTSRINVAHLMSQLILNDDIWKKWKGQMPVIYNKVE
ncbi:NAD(P)-dependent oxidoreductase [Marivirga sp.]|uniref:NAD(P)-dependent oxidoreductase n=1 Tax=Marivirga sp. TaxID=2018662 RepID=UPI0025CDC825|nr:NAD(P)-binding oxidoreductase [Marivirga sp.]